MRAMSATQIASPGCLVMLIGIGLFIEGGVVGDIAHHALLRHAAHEPGTLLGVDAYRAGASDFRWLLLA
jgi:hypothetical protein